MRRCSIRLPSVTWTSWKCTVFDPVAVNTFTGTVTRPKAMVPFQSERGATPERLPSGDRLLTCGGDDRLRAAGPRLAGAGEHDPRARGGERVERGLVAHAVGGGGAGDDARAGAGGVGVERDDGVA